MKVTLGECCLIEPGSTDGQAVDNDRGTSDKRKYMKYAYFNATISLLIITLIFWIVLVEQIVVGTCVQGADCFITPRSFSAIIIPDYSHVNCSTFESDTDSTLVCYKAGFYLLEAFSSTGGLLYIMTTFTQIIFPLATKGHKMIRNITIVVLILISVTTLAIYVIASYTLSTSTFGDIFRELIIVVMFSVVLPIMLVFLICAYPKS